MATQAERLKTFQELKNPLLKMQRLLTERAMAEAVGKMEMMKGDKGDPGEDGKDGYTPIKGLDYFTDAEILAVIKYVQERIVPGKDGKDGLNGKTPVKTVDYWTKKDQETIIKDVLSKIKVKDGVSPNIEDVVKNVLNKINLPDTKSFVTETKLSEFLRRGGFRGGGLSNITGYIQAGTNVTISGSGTAVDPYVISSTGGSGLSILTVVTGNVDDTDTVFTFASAPTLVVVNGATYRNGSSAMGGTISISGTTVTLPSPVGTGGDIYALG